MAFENILVERRDGIAIVTLNRPHVHNALSIGLVSELDAAITEFEQDDTVKAIVLTGAGERAFSAGADIHEMADLSPEVLKEHQERRAVFSWHLADCTKPTIGALNGLAYGGAALLTSSLDIRFGCERTKFRFLAASYGRVNSTWTLPLCVGWPMAKELLYSGRVVEAEEAYRIGLLNRLVPSDQLLETVVELGRTIAGNHAEMVQGIKRLLHEGAGLNFRERADLERDARSTKLKSPPPSEGFSDFLVRKGRKGGVESARND
ncbi:MAG: enoyl-CoA hydratase/isomerase family protein [Chloroflexi bacterium]|nr:enoyl-CoA hydratase/isomerase family protein [Chloroflexota bacterium]